MCIVVVTLTGMCALAEHSLPVHQPQGANEFSDVWYSCAAVTGCCSCTSGFKFQVWGQLQLMLLEEPEVKHLIGPRSLCRAVQAVQGDCLTVTNTLSKCTPPDAVMIPRMRSVLLYGELCMPARRPSTPIDSE